jgi:polysaccharide export outer membrane protein
VAIRPAPAPAPNRLFAVFHRQTPAAQPQTPARGENFETAAAGLLRVMHGGHAQDNTSVVASSWQPVVRAAAPSPVNESATLQVSHVPGQLDGATRSARELPHAQPGGQPVAIATTGTITEDPPVLPLPAPRLVPEAAHAGPPLVAHALPAPPAPHEGMKQLLPPYVVEPPDILLIRETKKIAPETEQTISGEHLVRPDGSVDLGIYGSVIVAGMTLDQIKLAVAAQIHARFGGKIGDKPVTPEDIVKTLQVDVLAYNSKWYYIITDGGGYGEQVYRVAITGNETVLDAISQINGLPAVASKKKIWVARAQTNDGAHPRILPVDWRGITQCASANTNYQIFPGDRVYVNSDALIRTDSIIGKVLAPIERVFGATLLGSSTVNSIRNGTNTGLGNGLVGTGR